MASASETSQLHAFRVSLALFHVCSMCLTLWDPMDCSPPGSSVRGILQARILECVAVCSSRGSSQPRGQTCVSCIAGRFFTTAAPGKLLGVREGGFIPLERAPRRIPTAAARGRREPLSRVGQWVLTSGGAELGCAPRTLGFAARPAPVAGPPIPPSVSQSQPLQVARLT